MKFDQYTLYARILPAVLTVIPLILFHHFYINTELAGFLYTIWSLHLVAEISMPMVLILTFAFINRLISKMVIEDKHYRAEREMPTTNILLFKNEFYSRQYKNKVHAKIFHDFRIKLLSLPEEEKREEEARGKIVEAVSLIRERVKGGRLLVQYNMEYGFFRNLVGGSIIAFLFSIFSATFFYFIYPSPLALKLSIISIGIYGAVLIFHKRILDWFGYQYAKSLIQEFIGL